MSIRAERNARALEGLYPAFADRIRWLLMTCEGLGMKLCILQGMRTLEEQERLYAQGRTADGPRVTDARAGQSFHNFGLAVDLVDFSASGNKDTYEPSDFDHTNYQKIAELAASRGIEWGGLFRTNVDRPHLEWHPGLTKREAWLLKPYANSHGQLPANVFETWSHSA